MWPGRCFGGGKSCEEQSYAHEQDYACENIGEEFWKKENKKAKDNEGASSGHQGSFSPAVSHDNAHHESKVGKSLFGVGREERDLWFFVVGESVGFVGKRIKIMHTFPSALNVLLAAG